MIIDKLLEKGIKKDTINVLLEDEVTYSDIEINIDDVLDVIDYLREIKIKNIDTLLLCYPDLFIGSRQDVESKFRNHGIPQMVVLINDDIENVELLYE
jgi:hypothetical protein